LIAVDLFYEEKEVARRTCHDEAFSIVEGESVKSRAE